MKELNSSKVGKKKRNLKEVSGYDEANKNVKGSRIVHMTIKHSHCLIKNVAKVLKNVSSSFIQILLLVHYQVREVFIFTSVSKNSNRY